MSSPALRRLRWALWLPLVLFAGFMALTLHQLRNPASTDVVSALVGKPLPAFDLPPALPGRAGIVTNDLATGKPRLLNVFASWCIPCAAEAPQLAALAKEGVEIDGVAIRDKPDDLAGFLTRNGNPYARIGADPVGTVQLAIGSSGVPESFVIDGRGVIRYQHIGEIREEQLPLIRQKLAEAGE
jgi:cytochrome c biogenesis protein CcmG, thiol:disulfide interchange protein DsbE